MKASLQTVGHPPGADGGADRAGRRGAGAGDGAWSGARSTRCARARPPTAPTPPTSCGRAASTARRATRPTESRRRWSRPGRAPSRPPPPPSSPPAPAVTPFTWPGPGTGAGAGGGAGVWAAVAGLLREDRGLLQRALAQPAPGQQLAVGVLGGAQGPQAPSPFNTLSVSHQHRPSSCIDIYVSASGGGPAAAGRVRAGPPAHAGLPARRLPPLRRSWRRSWPGGRTAARGAGLSDAAAVFEDLALCPSGLLPDSLAPWGPGPAPDSGTLQEQPLPVGG
ncbi:hypothetical protein SKAU_G00267710, partial [Synaphobranchus kaupii]